MNYEQDIRIDETALDVEWLEQPSLMMKYARVAIEARKKLDQAKEALDVAKAELDKNIRSNPERFGLEKITEGAITSAILTHKDYAKANQEMIEAKYQTDMANAAVRAVEARKDALENLVRLFGQSYFAGPKMPRDLTHEAQQRHAQKKADSAIKFTRKNK